MSWEQYWFVNACFNLQTKIFLHLFTGLFISIFCDSHTMANFMATGSFYPMVILCGIFWPIEGMPDLLKYVGKYGNYFQPTLKY